MRPDGKVDYLLGVDGGGTATRARLIDCHDRVLGEGRAGPSNLGLGVDVAQSALTQAIDDAFGCAGLGKSAWAKTIAGFGFASADIAGLPTIDTTGFGFRSVAVTSDAIAACYGAHRGADGAILIVGTGSQGVALVAGRPITLGGWGFHLGDQASGAILGRAALRAAALAREGLAPKSALTEEVMAEFGGSLDRAYVWALSATPADYAVWARSVVRHADDGDPGAEQILRQGVAWVELLIDKLESQGAARVCLMGGLAKTYAGRVCERSRRRLAEPLGDAMDGAILFARRMAVAG